MKKADSALFCANCRSSFCLEASHVVEGVFLTGHSIKQQCLCHRTMRYGTMFMLQEPDLFTSIYYVFVAKSLFALAVSGP